MSASPLSGLLVVDLSRHLPGPYASRLLRDLGARVIKVEEPTLGDPVRRAPPRHEGTGALASLLLAGVESVALDLKREGARRILERLLARADVLLETFRPGTLGRLGLGRERLGEINGKLVVCSLSGWGQGGPHARRAGHDLTYQALAGCLAPTGRMPSLPAADLLGAWSAAAAVLAALVERQRTGRGAWIDAALLDGATHGNLIAFAADVEAAKAVGEPLFLTGGLPCYNLYRTREGKLFALAALERKFWRRFCRALRRPDLLPLQYRGEAAVRRKVAEVMRSRTREEWTRLCAELDLPGEPVLSVGEARVHPQQERRDLVRDGGDGLPRLGFPALFDGERPRGRDRVPALGEQTAEVLREFDPQTAARPRRELRADGIGRARSPRKLLWRLLSSSRS